MRDAVFALSTMYLVFVGFAFLLPVLVRNKADYDTVKRYLWGGRAYTPAGFLGIALALGVALAPKSGAVVVGDLLPLLVLLLDAVVLLMGRVRFATTLDAATLDRATTILGNLQIPIGALSMAAGLIHALLSGLLFL